MAESARRGVPEATVGRLPGYLRVLTELADDGRALVSSEELAELAGVRSAQVRKDLSALGSYGVRGVGYEIARLSGQVAAELGLRNEHPLVIVGMGNLGRALASYSGLATRGFEVVALIDNDPHVIGTQIHGLTVQSFQTFDPRVTPVAVGVIATPVAAAQDVAEQLVSLGVHSLLNLAPGVLRVPDDVHVRAVDLATELQILAFHAHQQRPQPLQEEVG